MFCYGVVDRVEDNQRIVILVEREKQELVVAINITLREGSPVQLRRHSKEGCEYKSPL